MNLVENLLFCSSFSAIPDITFYIYEHINIYIYIASYKHQVSSQATSSLFFFKEFFVELNQFKISSESSSVLSLMKFEFDAVFVQPKAKCFGVGSNPVVGTTNNKPTVNSAVHPSEDGKYVLRHNSEGTSYNAAGPHELDSCPYTQPAIQRRWR